jgi:hypothetical protein
MKEIKKKIEKESQGSAWHQSRGGHFLRGMRTEFRSAAATRTATETFQEKLGPVSTANQGQRALLSAAFCNLAISPTLPAKRGKEDKGVGLPPGTLAAWISRNWKLTLSLG